MILGKNLKNKKLSDAVKEANRILELDEFYTDISMRRFDKSTAHGSHIATAIKEFRDGPRVFEVVEYRSRFPSRVNAYVLTSNPNRLYINVRNVNSRTLASVVATVVHEAVHAVDAHDKKHSYGHGDNSAAGKANCAPNWIGNHAKKFVRYSSDKLTHFMLDEDNGYNEEPGIVHLSPLKAALHGRAVA
jgi:hypothetical protein